MKVHTVEHARPTDRDRRCSKCGHMVQPGERYFYLDHWRAPRSFWCSGHPPRPSDMVVSETKRKLYLAQEALQDAAALWDPTCGAAPVLEALRDASAVATEVAGYYRSLSGDEPLPEGDQMTDNAEHVERWRTALDDMAGRIEAAGVADDPSSRRAAVLRVADGATIYDNWHFQPEDDSGEPAPAPT